MENNPQLWLKVLPRRIGGAHKYDYGHAVIYGAPFLIGATRLAAIACARIGAGLTTVLADEAVVQAYRVSLPAHIMVRDDITWSDTRFSALLYGCGGLLCEPDFQSTLPIVLDADAIQQLPGPLSENFILTPHEGEFERAFPRIKGERLERARQAAEESQAIIVLKGSDTVIAHPDGRIVINTHASPNLATAGSGDVLAGMIAGLLAQSMEPFDAACAAVWIHGDASLRFGAGLVASDIPEIIPEILQDLT